MITLRDIADEVGVSVSAVSLVLNERGEGRVRAEVATRIREVAQDMGYIPNLLAKGLKTRQSLTLGMISDRVASIPFAGQMLAGAQVAAAEDGFLLMVIDTAGDAGLEGPGVRALLQRNIEGLIVAAEFHREVQLPLVPQSIPTVILDGRPPASATSVDWVVPDEAGGAYAATRHLIEAGHRRIAFCNVSDRTFIARRLRRDGYERALSEAGITLDPTLVVEAVDPSAAAGRAAAGALLQQSNRPTAVFCFSDQIAFGFYQVAQTMGLTLPRDLSIVGFDNQQFVADSLLPGLTTIQLPHREMGVWAAKQAIARNRATDLAASHRLMPCPLIQRSSVAPPAA